MNITFMNAKETAKYLGVALSTLYKWTSKHSIPYYSPMGKKLLFKKSELDEWIEKTRVTTHEEVVTLANEER